MKPLRLPLPLLTLTLFITLSPQPTHSKTLLLSKSRIKQQFRPSDLQKQPNKSQIHPRILNEDNEKFLANVDKMTDAYQQMDELLGKIRGQMLDVKHTYFAQFAGLVNQLDADGGGSVLDKMIEEHQMGDVGDRRII